AGFSVAAFAWIDGIAIGALALAAALTLFAVRIRTRRSCKVFAPPTPRSPLARGLLAGNRTRDGERHTVRARTDPFGKASTAGARLRRDRPRTHAVRADCADRARTPSAQVALAWLLHKPGVTAPIVGATRLEHLEDALAAVELALDEKEIRRLKEPYLRHSVSGTEV
ncbi:MAG: aldo/keto reductase, partial [Gaiellaceae bacterium]